MNSENREGYLGRRDLLDRIPPQPEAKQPLEIMVAGNSVASTKHPEINEDAFFVSGSDGEFRGAGVFDGVAGEAGGQFAAEAARNEVSSYLIEVMGNYPHGLTSDQAEKIAQEAIRKANDAVLRKQGEEIEGKSYPNMLTTGCIVVPYREKRTENGREITVYGVVVANVGDSRAYRLTDGKLKQVSVDDNLIRIKVNNDDEALRIQSMLNNVSDPNSLPKNLTEYFGQRNIITQALGNQRVEPSIISVELKQGDRVILCTDGIFDNLTDEEMEKILDLNPNSADAVSNLINAAQERANSQHQRAKPDDMTAVVITFGRGETSSSSSSHLPSSSEESRSGLPKVLKGLADKVKNLLNNQTIDLQPGSKVVVIRSSGDVDEELWTVAEIDRKTGMATVIKDTGNTRLQKSVSLNELYEWNKLTTEEDIKGARNRSQLCWILARLEENRLKGSQTSYTSEDLIKQVNDFFAGRAKLTDITRAGDLRETVFNLLIEEIKAGKVSKEILSKIYQINPGLDKEIKKGLRKKGFFRILDEILP